MISLFLADIVKQRRLGIVRRGGQAAAAALADGEDRASADLAAGRPAAEEHQGDGEVRYEIRNSAKVRKVKSAFSF